MNSLPQVRLTSFFVLLYRLHIAGVNHTTRVKCEHVTTPIACLSSQAHSRCKRSWMEDVSPKGIARGAHVLYWLRPRLFTHGNQWCALVGENVQSGVAGFGYTPADAFKDLDRRSMPPLVIKALQHIRGERFGKDAPLSNSPASFLQPEEQRDGNFYQVLYGQTLKTVLWASGKHARRLTLSSIRTGSPTGPLAFMGKSTLPDEEIEREDRDPAQWIDRGDKEQDSANWWKRPDDSEP